VVKLKSRFETQEEARKVALKLRKEMYDQAYNLMIENEKASISGECSSELSDEFEKLDF